MATDMVDKLLKGETIAELKDFTLAELTNNPDAVGNIKANFLPVYQVTKDNVYELIVKSCFQPYDDVYRDIPEADRPAKVECPAA
jgi:D-xylose transport system substrate-binding protein